MTGTNWKTTLLLASLVTLWTLPWSGACLPAQEAQTKTPAATAKPERAKPRGRLPAYYARVVSASQRETIYDIQAKFEDELKQLQERMQELLQQRDREVEGVLTQEQRKQIAAYVEDAKSRRSSAGESPEKSPEKSPEASEATSAGGSSDGSPSDTNPSP
jgi:predicted exporter